MDVAALVVIFVFIAAMSVIQARSRERRDRIRLLEQAIRSGHFDDVTRERLIAEVWRSRGGADPGGRPGGGFRLAFSLGWLGLFLGIGLMAMDDRDTWYAGIAVTALSFALVTLPIALREIERPSGRAAPRP